MLCNVKNMLTLRFLTVSAFCLTGLLVSGCADTQTGVASGDRSKYGTIAVVPQVNDRLMAAYWANPLADPVVSEARLGWNAAEGTGKMAREILARAGASVVVTSSQNSSAAKAAEAVVVLRQTPLNELAEKYDPGRDFALSAVSIAAAAQYGGIAYIIIDDEANYQPRSVLRITRSDIGGEGGANHCAVGLTPVLVDAKTGQTIQTGRSLMGIEKLPGSLSSFRWSSFTASERSTILAYCQSALRRAVSQAFVELRVVD